MKKTYIQPSTKAYTVKTATILAASGGVSDGSKVGRSYNSDDVSYGKSNSDDDWF